MALSLNFRRQLGIVWHGPFPHRETPFIYLAVEHWGWSGAGFVVHSIAKVESVSLFAPAYIDFAKGGMVHWGTGI